MGRTRLPDAAQLQSWDDVNRALMEIAHIEIELAALEGDMNIKLNEIKEQAAHAGTPLLARADELGKALKTFAELNRPDFGKQKSRKLTFGTLG